MGGKSARLIAGVKTSPTLLKFCSIRTIVFFASLQLLSVGFLVTLLTSNGTGERASKDLSESKVAQRIHKFE